MNKQSGFAVVEILVVSVILGIFTVIATPRFIDLEKDSNIASLNGLVSVMQQAAEVTYELSRQNQINTNTKVEDDISPANTSSVIVGSESVETKYGYPIAAQSGITHAIIGLEYDSNDWIGVTDSVAGQYIVTLKSHTSSPDVNRIKNNQCYILYTEAKSEEIPAKVEIKESRGC